jgi:hypothetical protein
MMRKAAVSVAVVAVEVYMDAKLVIILEGVGIFTHINFSLLKNLVQHLGHAHDALY